MQLLYTCPELVLDLHPPLLILYLQSLFDEYPKAFIVNVDNVGSNQMQQIRISLRGRGVALMGKNTTIRKAIRGHLDQNPNLEKIIPHIRGNVGFVFTKEDLNDIRELIEANKVCIFLFLPMLVAKPFTQSK